MKTDNKLKGRDLINVGIYGAIYFVILFAVAMLGMNPIFLPLLSVLVPILGGIPFMLFLTKVKKPGMIFIFATIMGILMLLTGPSGCGKTTILRLINGLIPHFYPGTMTGNVTIDGEPVQERELYETAAKVGTVFQNPRSQFYNVDTTGELAFGCENRGLPEREIFARIDDTVSRFHLEKLMDRNIFRLSDGEKQKIACASVDVSGTEIILLDEPSANLDAASTMALRELIQLWQHQDKTIIAAEHRIAYLWDLIDRAAGRPDRHGT